MSDTPNRYICQKCGDLHPHGVACPAQSELAAPAGSARSSVFFTADVSETVDYVLDQAAMYKDRSAFVAAVIEKLKPWNEEAPNDPSSSAA